MKITYKDTPCHFWIVDSLIKVAPLTPSFISPLTFIPYHNELEYKYATPNCPPLPLININSISPPVDHSLQGLLRSTKFIQWMEKETGSEGIIADEDLHGGGLHAVPNGGYLGLHLDYSVHAKRPMFSKAMGLVVHLPSWGEVSGGDMQFSDPCGRYSVNIEYVPNRIIIFKADELAYHGVATTTCSPGSFRFTYNQSYLKVRKQSEVRTRALFIPRRPQDAIRVRLL